MSRRFFEKRVLKILKTLGQANKILSITFVTDRFMARLNKRYLKKKGPTNVLSFPMNSHSCLLGDVLISLDTAKRQAKQKKVGLHDLCLFLAIHGILHLLGYDHQKTKDWILMRKKEIQLSKMLGYEKASL